MTHKHILFGVGVGPGDPELLTMKAVKNLQNSPVIAYPAASGGNSFSYDIARQYCNEQAILLRMDIDMIPGNKTLPQLYAPHIETIRHHLKTHSVSVLCEGDPLFYGSFQYIMHALAGETTIQIIPGISAPNAFSALLQKPLGSRNESLGIITGPSDEAHIIQAITQHKRVVIIKIGRHFLKVKQLIAELGLLKSSYLGHYVTVPGKEQYQPLSDDIESAPYFSMIYIEKP